MDILIQRGWDMTQAKSVAVLYEEAFGEKFACAIPLKDERIALLADCFQPEFSFVAVENDRIVGLAGFQTPQGALTDAIGFKQLVNQLGWLRAVWACLIFALFSRKPKQGELVMDGIAVDRHFRSLGIGSQLLDQLMVFAAESGFVTIRLDVIDSNPRARKLYERKGFAAKKTEYFPYLKWLIGFSAATTMIFTITQKQTAQPKVFE
ncbi:GNAT family N-acetyltransferase [Pseudoalteromonas mariniglutinosa]|uniref:GNAT family N-acetyltransferase n=1 Tax=Pseudoalteromonas mariniglutinosa TaxID=206042 RepID=UPI00384B3C6E